ncbi:MAG: hypothetical protein WDM89_01095 [Rhizomicrobium sp.]
MRYGTHARRHHHIDEVCRIAHPIAQRVNLRAPRPPLRRVAAMLARVAIALRRTGALAIAGVWTGWRNIIVPRK